MNLPFANQGDAVDLSRPDHEAIVEVRDGATRRVTYRAFDAAVEALADDLAGSDLPAGSKVAILGANGTDWLVAFYATLRAGHVAVPVSYKLPPDGLAYVLENSEAALVLADDVDPVRAVAAAGVEVRPLRGLADLGQAGGAAGGQGAAAARSAATARSARPARRPRSLDDPAMILYTSGSTGYPKGVVLSQRSHLWVMSVALERGIDPAARFVVAAPLYHMNALSNVQTALAGGATVILLDRFEPRAFLTAVATERGTRVTGVPPMFAMMLAETDLTTTLDLTSVDDIFVGSAPAGDALLESIERLFPNGALHFGYGTTESGPVAFGDHPDGLPTPRGSVGAASPAVDLRLVDDAGRPQERRGVLEIRCPALLTGYYRRPDVPTPVTPDGFYHTRDVFEMDENGFYFFAGREDDMFSSGGENVYPRAVEQVLESYPGVLHAAVVPVPDDVKGAKPVAFVVPVPGQEVTEAELRRHVLSQLEPYAHPRRVFFVDELPLAATNKVDRHVLEERAARLLRSGG
ncbi:acyl-CoA synthetase (AMP-forming)/AMP-acid ligase II [Georgenia soli]|uniref:Acyl-CoA synthetase (AMP-forming)/AMP-acid ligase II n=1 Tax=Georgenia soli TaxID=638953 RepID=A0A2A9ELI4_9MICO|nr:class I adenylate-forming enzyme family protein [Georgenia soli]PFG39663.1 acyl-CoA synthetase (AMP-forming)/AMP-acid ligase II [Georgenia soli]